MAEPGQFELRQPALAWSRIRSALSAAGSRVGVIVLLLTAFLLRIAVAEFMLTNNSNDRNMFFDAELYQAYATKIYREQSFMLGDFGARRTPGYPIFIAGCWVIGGLSNERAVIYSQCVLSTITCWLTYLLSRQVYGGFEPMIGPRTESASVVAGSALVMSVCDFYASSMAAVYLAETLFTTLFTASVLLVAFLIKQVNPRNSTLLAFASGVLLAAATLVRPSSLLLIVPFVGVALISRWTPHKAMTRGTFLPALWMLVGFVIVMAPWWIRNMQVYRRLVMTTLNVGESLYDGVQPNANGGSEMSFTDSPAVQQFSEIDRDEHWKREAIRLINADRLRIAKLAGIKIARFWSPWPNETSFRRWHVIVAGLISSLPAYVGGIIMLACLFTKHRLLNSQSYLLLAMLVLPMLYFTGLHAIFVSSVRYRIPVMPMLHVLAGLGYACWLARVGTTAPPQPRQNHPSTNDQEGA